MARRVEGPWFRKGTGTWYATLGGQSVPLGVRGKGNEEAARLAWHKAVSEPATLPAVGAPPLAPQLAQLPTLPPPPSQTPAVTVGDVRDRFLDDVRDRAKPNTTKTYAFFFPVVRGGVPKPARGRASAARRRDGGAPPDVGALDPFRSCRRGRGRVPVGGAVRDARPEPGPRRAQADENEPGRARL